MNCYVFVLDNEQGKRIGIVKWYETGYYVTNYDYHTNAADAKEHVKLLNEKSCQGTPHGTTTGLGHPVMRLER